MAVEILILSGARQGERLVLDTDRFTAGDSPDCEVSFNSQVDSGAKGRSAVFQRRDDGWQLHSTGAGEIYLDDYQPVGQSRHLRSGALVRLSEQGPDFEFRITTAKPRPAGSGLPADAPIAVADNGPTAVSGAREPAPAPPAASAPDSSASSSPAPPPISFFPRRRRTWVFIRTGAEILAAMAAVALLVVAVMRPPSVTLVDGSKGSTAAAASKGQESAGDKAERSKGHEEEATKKPESEAPENKVAPPVVEKPADPLESLKQRLLLLQVRLVRGKETSCWPFATGCLVREDAVLTTAAAACELAKLRSQKLALFAVDGSGTRQYEIDELYIPRNYVELAQEPDRAYRYFNLALLALKTKADRDQVVGLASPDQLAELKDGMRLKSVGFGHDGQKMSREETLTPAVVEGKVFLVTSPPPHAPDGPRLLHVTAPMPENCLGCPLVDARGNVVGLYADVAVSDQEKAIKDLRFFTVAAPKLVGAWLEDPQTPLWMPAPVVEAEGQPKP